LEDNLGGHPPGWRALVSYASRPSSSGMRELSFFFFFSHSAY
jgi:hypothetical protein